MCDAFLCLNGESERRNKENTNGCTIQLRASVIYMVTVAAHNYVDHCNHHWPCDILVA